MKKIIIIIGLVLVMLSACTTTPKTCEYEDVTPDQLVGAMHWKNINTGEEVVCPVVAPEYITEQCKEITSLC